ncbi:DUF4279 domain-containing protein [Ruegeria sp. EL01]|jgi:hypothetical protein|uniref:DUF4279 domain-containing protein n=1 Tax=Ruegeria sp. EL01 TaxID=2107578 RepID=UPI000EA836F1|nr:DUF4279 domain-containing protein [Ruegeria sp. EL01]
MSSQDRDFECQDFALHSTLDRQYAYFAITSDEAIASNVDLIPLEPSRYWNAGEKVIRAGRDYTRRGSRWVLESGFDESVGLEEHIQAVVEKIGSVSSLLKELPEHCESAIVCVSFSVQSSGFKLSPALLKQIADLDIYLEYDFYANVDPHDELADLRSLIPRDK